VKGSTEEDDKSVCKRRRIWRASRGDEDEDLSGTGSTSTHVVREETADGEISGKDYVTAFYDEVTGEVYEGGWSSTTQSRHGRGVCLYADGYM
jgi:hypothetical protein